MSTPKGVSAHPSVNIGKLKYIDDCIKGLCVHTLNIKHAKGEVMNMSL